MAYHTTKKKIEVRTKELEELNSNVGLGAGAGAGVSGSRKKALRDELNQLQKKMNTFSGTKNLVSRLSIKNYGIFLPGIQKNSYILIKNLFNILKFRFA